MAKRFSTPFAVAGAAVRVGHALSLILPTGDVGVGSTPRKGVKGHTGRCESFCIPFTSRGPVSLPIAHPRLLFYGLRCGTMGAEAGYGRPLGQSKTNTSGS